MRDDRLVTMANQIAANVPDPEHAAEQTAAHLRTFWAPVMIEDLAAIAHVRPELVAAGRARGAVDPRTPSTLRFRAVSGT